MTICWCEIQLLCTKCDKTDHVVIARVSSSADAELKIDYHCTKCGQAYFWRATFAKLQLHALLQDLTPIILPPRALPKQLPPPNPGTGDLDFLKDMGIDPQGEK